MKPLISVLMPVYNGEKYLKQAIDSILQQSLKEIEFIIVDDASTDNSLSIIQSYNDPRIRIFSNQTNLGISASLNKGIELAETDWIARMDADDISYPHRLQKQYDYSLQHPDVALISSWASVIDENGKEVRLEKYETPYYYYNLNFECWIYHPTVLYNRTAVIAVGKYTEQFSEDFELFWQLSRKYKIGNIEEALIDYRITSQSLHQVIRKTEYEEAQEKQVLRNIAFYMGPDFQINKAQLECLRHNFTLLLSQNNCTEILQCLDKLRSISSAIAATDNINKDLKYLREAIWYKRNFIIDFFARNLEKQQAVIFLIRLGAWKKLYRLMGEHIRRIFN